MKEGDVVLNILKMCDISASSSDVLLKDPTGEFDCYCYPWQPLASDVFTTDAFTDILLKDQVDYLLAHPEDAGNRRVGFLFIVPSGELCIFWVEYSGLNKEIAAELLSTIHSETKITSDILINNQENLANLYAQKNCQLIDFSGTFQRESDSLKSLCENLENAYTDNYKLRIKTLDKKNNEPTTTLTTCLLQLFSHGTITKNNIKNPYAPIFKKRMDLLKQQSPEIYQKLMESLTVLIKYIYLKNLQAENSLKKNASIQDLEEMQLKYNLHKKKLYLTTFEENNFPFEDLPPELILLLLEAETTEVLMEKINNQRKNLLKNLKKWESHLEQQLAEKQSSKNYLYSYWFGQVGQSLYQSSFISMGAELMPLIGRNFVSRPVLPMLQWAGGILGLAATCYSAYYSLFSVGYSLGRSMLINALGAALQKLLGEIILDDTEAKAILPKMGILGYTRLSILLTGFIESKINNDPRYLINAVGGIFGSISLVEPMRFLNPSLHSDSSGTMTENQSLALFSLSLTGQYLGSWLSGSGYSIWEESNTRAELQEAFCGFVEPREATDCEVEFPPQKWAPHFWGTPNDKVRLGFQKNSRHYEAHCDIIPNTQPVLIDNCKITPPRYDAITNESVIPKL